MLNNKDFALNILIVFELILAVLMGTVLYLAIQVLFGNMKNIAVEYNLLGNTFITGPEDVFFNFMFFFSFFGFLGIFFSLVCGLEYLIKKESL